MTDETPRTPTTAVLDAAWKELVLDALASDGRISDADVKNAVARHRPRIEAEARAPLDVAYRERNAVVAALIRSHGWPAEVVMAPDTEGWWIVYAETPQGQVSWHIGPDDMDLFSEWPVAFGTARSPWDGHSTEEKYRRLAALRAALEEPTP